MTTNGRPPEEEDKPASLKKWEPKRWQPEYERMVGMSALGLSNIVIAEKTGYTKEHVSNILNTEQALELKKAFVARIREKSFDTVGSLLGEASIQGARRIKQVLDSDDLFEKSPFAVVGVATDVLKGLGNLKGGGNGAPTINVGTTNVNGSAMVMNGDQASQFLEALKATNEAARLNPIHEVSQNIIPPKKDA
jgi:hypothetical protein